MFKQGDSDALAAKISEVASLSVEERKQISERAREKAKNFDIETYVTNLDNYVSSFS